MTTQNYWTLILQNIRQAIKSIPDQEFEVALGPWLHITTQAVSAALPTLLDGSGGLRFENNYDDAMGKNAYGIFVNAFYDSACKLKKDKIQVYNTWSKTSPISKKEIAATIMEQLAIIKIHASLKELKDIQRATVQYLSALRNHEKTNLCKDSVRH